jgi:osmoprotectant transport system ATP-binding protein
MIAFDNVSVSYDGDRTFAVRDVSLDIADGTFVALVGASGSGKTSLLKTINRLSDPSRGEVRVEGDSVTEGDAADLRRRIGYVFQGVGLFPHMTVAENIGVTPSLLGWPKEKIASRAQELIDLVDLPRDFLSRRPDALSGGQRQRIGVARALAAQPKIMLMDEPFGALDPLTRDALGKAYRAMHEQLGLTTIMVTHDMLEAALLADRIIVFDQGRVIADDMPAVLLTSETEPAVAELLSLPRRQSERIGKLVEDWRARHE